MSPTVIKAIDKLPYLIPEEPGRISGGEIRRLTGIDGSDIRKAVNFLRQNGQPIGSDGRGYFYITTKESAVKTIRRLDNQALHIQQARDGLIRLLNGGE